MQTWLSKLRRAGYTVLFLHHGSKPDDRGRSKQRRTSKREDVLNTSVMLQRLPGMTSDTFEWEFTKSRGFRPNDPFWVTIGIDGWVSKAGMAVANADRDAEIVALNALGYTQREIASRCGCSVGLVNKVLQRAAQAGPML